MKILLVEDELSLGDYIKKGLSEAGFIVEHQTTGLGGYHALMTEDFNEAAGGSPSIEPKFP